MQADLLRNFSDSKDQILIVKILLKFYAEIIENRLNNMIEMNNSRSPPPISGNMQNNMFENIPGY